MKYKAHDYQQYATDFIIRHPVSCLILDMGLGKTLQVICYLLSEYQEREIQEKSRKEPVEKEQDIENEGRQREKKS